MQKVWKPDLCSSLLKAVELSSSLVEHCHSINETNTHLVRLPFYTEPLIGLYTCILTVSHQFCIIFLIFNCGFVVLLYKVPLK